MSSAPTGKPQKPPKRKFALVFDTNFLFSSNKLEFFSWEFKKILNEHGDEIDLYLFVPEVVSQELKFQAFEEVIEKSKSYQKARKVLEGMTGLTLAPVPEDVEQVRNLVDSVYDDQFKKSGFKVIPTPHDLLDTKIIQRMSVTRSGVFSTIREGKDGKEVEVGEKGFRDYLILKSIEKFLQDFDGAEVVLALTGDKLLIREIQKIVGSKLKLEVFSDWQKASSYLASVISDSDSKWIQELLPLANLQFFDQINTSGLWFSSAKGKVLKDFSEEIAASVPFDSLSFLNRSEMKWAHTGTNFTIQNPTFEKKAGSAYIWKSRVVLIKEFTRENPLVAPRNSFWEGFESSAMIRGFPAAIESCINKTIHFPKKLIGAC